MCSTSILNILVLSHMSLIYCMPEGIKSLEYFSRIDQIDKWLNSEPIQKKDTFIHPKFNIRE
jgi:hypothetical protein